MPAWEELRMPDEREVVQRDRERHGCPQGAAEGRAVEEVEPACRARQPAVVPPRVAGDRRRLAGAAERTRRHLESLATCKRAEQPADMARRSGARLHERRDVDRRTDHADAPS